MSYCGETTLVKHDRENLTANALKCQSWHCPDCYPNRRLRLIAEACGGRPNTFLTFTFKDDQTLAFPEQVRKLSRGWRLLRLRALREATRDLTKKHWPYGSKQTRAGPYCEKHPCPRQVRLIDRKLPFLAVIEKHKKGQAHLHLLARSEWIDFWWMQANWIDITDAHHVRVERCRTAEKSAAYCAKYCGKVREEIIGAKRYWKSRDYERRPERRNPPPRPPHIWTERDMRPLHKVTRTWIELGYQVELAGAHLAYARPPPGGLYGDEARRGGSYVPEGTFSKQAQ